MELTMSRATLSLAVLIAIVCCADAMNYLAFPRMGRSSKDHSLQKRDVDPQGGRASETTGPRRTRFPSNFFTPRKRTLQLASPEALEATYFDLDKTNLPYNFIVPRKRGFPKGFFVPRKRDGRYLAFPRMGRSGEKVISDSANACCGIGLKEEFVLGDDGKEQLRTFCASTSKCCAGLKEIMDEKPDGLYYYMCVPDILAVGRR